MFLHTDPVIWHSLLSMLFSSFNISHLENYIKTFKFSRPYHRINFHTSFAPYFYPTKTSLTFLECHPCPLNISWTHIPFDMSCDSTDLPLTDPHLPNILPYNTCYYLPISRQETDHYFCGCLNIHLAHYLINISKLISLSGIYLDKIVRNKCSNCSWLRLIWNDRICTGGWVWPPRDMGQQRQNMAQ